VTTHSQTPYLTVDDVAVRYHSTRSALHVQRSRGKAPGSLGIRVGKRLLWKVADLEEWEESQKVAGRVSS
jgi:hypothetical protein